MRRISRRSATIYPLITTALLAAYVFDGLPLLRPPAWLTQGMPADPALRHPDIARNMFLLLLLPITLLAAHWINVYRLLRHQFFHLLLSFAARKLLSKRGAVTIAVVFLAAVLISVSLAEGLSLRSYFVKIQLVIAAGALLVVLEPPIALVLGRSASSNDVLELTARPLMPFRTIHLIDSFASKRMVSVSGEDNLRTMGDSLWRSSVRSLSQVVPIVIVDGRQFTPHVHEEIKLIMATEPSSTLLMVTNPDGSTPGVATAAAKRRFRAVHLGELPLAVASTLYHR